MVFADLNEAAAEAAVQESRQYATNPTYGAIAVQVDVSDPDSVDRLVLRTVAEFGRIDYSVNSAGVCGDGPTQPRSRN